MKKVLSFAIIAMAMSAFNGAAQTATTDNATRKVCVADKCSESGRQHRAVCLYDGLDITDAQKSQLKQLDASRREARKAQAEARKADKQKNDSVCRAQCRAEKKEYLDKVKAIVGPEQYVVFLENLYINGGGHGRVGKAFAGKGRMAKIGGMRKMKAAATAPAAKR